MTFTVNIFLAFHNLFMMLVHMEVHLKGYFLMRIQSKFEAWWIVGCPRNPETSQTEKLLWATRFSHYLGQKHYRNEKIFEFFQSQNLTSPVQKFSV